MSDKEEKDIKTNVIRLAETGGSDDGGGGGGFSARLGALSARVNILAEKVDSLASEFSRLEKKFDHAKYWAIGTAVAVAAIVVAFVAISSNIHNSWTQTTLEAHRETSERILQKIDDIDSRLTDIQIEFYKHSTTQHSGTAQQSRVNPPINNGDQK
jgi:hypothetical protein